MTFAIILCTLCSFSSRSRYPLLKRSNDCSHPCWRVRFHNLLKTVWRDSNSKSCKINSSTCSAGTAHCEGVGSSHGDWSIEGDTSTTSLNKFQGFQQEPWKRLDWNGLIHYDPKWTWNGLLWLLNQYESVRSYQISSTGLLHFRRKQWKTVQFLDATCNIMQPESVWFSDLWRRHRCLQRRQNYQKRAWFSWWADTINLASQHESQAITCDHWDSLVKHAYRNLCQKTMSENFCSDSGSLSGVKPLSQVTEPLRLTAPVDVWNVPGQVKFEREKNNCHSTITGLNPIPSCN